MGFVPGFENDIFISYCHHDNAAPQGQKGWVDVFHEYLESRLECRFGRKKPAVWRDKNLQGNSLFGDVLKEKVTGSALFLALVSPRYLESEYCKQELQWFHSRAGESQTGLNLNNQSRLFNILLRNIPYRSWPTQMEGLSGFPMFPSGDDAAKAGGYLDHSRYLYRQKLDKIVDAVETMLKSFPGAVTAAAVSTAEVDGLSLFIADVPDSLQRERRQLEADLAKTDVGILSPIPPPWDAASHERAVRETIRQADLSVHLLDALPGRQVEGGGDRTYPRAQVEIGLSVATPQLVWVPKELRFEDIPDVAYGAFLQSLERGTRDKADFQFCREARTDLADLVNHELEQIRARRARETGKADDAAIVTLLNCHSKDRHFSYKLADYLEEQGVHVDLIPETRDPAAGLRNFEEALEHARNLVIVYGTVAPAWVLQRLRKTIQHVASQLVEGFKASLEHRWVCLLPNSNLTPEMARLAASPDFPVRLLDNSHSERPDKRVLKPLLRACKKGGVS